LPDYPRNSTAFLLSSDSAQALATAEFGSVLPGIVATAPHSADRTAAFVSLEISIAFTLT